MTNLATLGRTRWNTQRTERPAQVFPERLPSLVGGIDRESQSHALPNVAEYLAAAYPTETLCPGVWRSVVGN